MTADFNRTAPIRTGEELPVERLAAYLRERLPDSAGPLVVEQFPQGHSNLTYLLRLGDVELVLRRPPFGNQVKSAHDMAREYRVLSHLSAVYAPAPRPFLHCEDPDVIGSEFYVMERRRGLILRKTIPPEVTIDSQAARRLSTALIDNLARLHSLDFNEAGLGDLGKPEGYVERQVTGWASRYEKARTDDIASMERLAAWLAGQIPPESGAAIIHNDYKYDNLILDASELTHIVAVLDWEMATIGDPLMDLGSTLGYWVEASDPQPLRQAAFGPTALPGSLTRRELLDRYQEQSGRTVPNPVFYYAFGLFKLAVIVQQIYARYVRGHTRDPRFAHLNQLVVVLGEQAESHLASGIL
jgi:aminoglycoside phosphotransferase (APT) family kinase protein